MLEHAMPEMTGTYGVTQFSFTDHLEDGQVINFDNGHIMIGTRPLSDVDATIKRLCINTFGEPFLRKLGIYGPTSEEIMKTLRRKPRTQ